MKQLARLPQQELRAMQRADPPKTPELVQYLLRLDVALVELIEVLRRELDDRVVTLVDAATVTVDAAFADKFKLTLAGNRTLANPTNVVDGQRLDFVFKQDGTGSRTLAYGSKYKFPGGTAPTLSTGANKVDGMTCRYDSANDILLCDAAQDYR